MAFKHFILFVVLSVPVLFARLFSQEEQLYKVLDDVESYYTTVGEIGLTVTNFGTIGTRNNYWPRQPSCEFPRGSRIEHVYQGGLWVGAILKTKDPSDLRNNQPLVSTAANDRSSASRRGGEGYEFTTEIGDSMKVLSSLTYDRPVGSYFSPMAVSHQDFICKYSDRNTRVPQTGDSILNHLPLGIQVHQESYAWNFPFANFFVILRYNIKNVSPDTLDSVYVGFWNNAVVRNTNYVRPGTSGYFEYGAHGFDPELRMVYSFDYNGLPGNPPIPANSYIGLKLLGTTPFPRDVSSLSELKNKVYFNAWRYRSSLGEIEFFSPTDDYDPNRYLSRYSRMTQSMPQFFIDTLRKGPGNYTYLISTGPFERLKPGDSLEVVFAVVCAKKKGTAPARLDTREQRDSLYSNAMWAQQAYNGEDVNGNNILDDGEDIARRDSISPTELGLRYEPDGKITRYLLPTPPRRPRVRAEVGNQSVVIFWDSTTAEQSVDPISGKMDFEGYRIYRSKTGVDFQSHEDFTLKLQLIAEFDRADNRFGYNTGFGKIKVDTMFPGDTIRYRYRFPPEGDTLKHLNGWQYIYGISAFDSGDPQNNVPSLESAKSLVRVIPGTLPNSSDDADVFVYPNPYYANAYWDGSGERLRKIYFANLPKKCEIRIYTLAGDVVAIIDHDASTYDGTDIEWYRQFGDPSTQPKFAGGEHAWDLITKHDQAIATGLYLFTVEDKETSKVKRGKFLIIK